MRRTSNIAIVFTSLSVATLGALVACGSDGSSSFDESSSGNSSGASSGASSSGFVSGSSGTTTSSGGSSGFNPDATCAATTLAAQRAPANLLFIIDRSGSMNCNPPPTTTSAACEINPVTANMGQPTKWSITRDALKAAVAGMPTTNSVGLTYFNNDDDCGVQATPKVPIANITSGQTTLVNASLDGITPKGYTPIVGGVTLGYQHLHGPNGPTMGNNFLVLLTDGAETCAPDQQEGFVTTTVNNAAAVGIRTFVIGAPGSEGNRAFLSRIAFNGKTAKSATCKHAATPATEGDCHFDLTNAGTNLATELNAALESISKQALSCDLDVPVPDGGQVDYDKVNVVYTPSGAAAQTIKQDAATACSSANGWQYSADHKHILLCGAICDTVKGDPTGTLSVQLGCATESITR